MVVLVAYDSLKVWSVWVKTPLLRGAEILIASECLQAVNPELFKELSNGKVTLLACPEREPAAYYGKIASIIRSSKPKKITVVTIDGSPHCFALQASVNEAEYILGESIEREHYVVVNGRKLIRISPNTIRVARYLGLVNEIIEKNPTWVERLKELSEEFRRAQQYK
ncbi:4Fe-4S ferredoxin [Candidatus Methanodesulfokora washburnensis]|jgi:hypothetical protein|uniref:4Fe-4S ferredoxin n=1 Tax=Candidatus Methanodesulfokora washburnensis TaxID=2478471 RepID=A0A429GUD3_9CREN|nr:4Fe-4S ferredoxin [Candidatus Methanodesulfokores washburnensis]RSN77676.1 4Fe-4S ferredoxin [Candidatus Methanodesulfokores washburnensis]